MRTKKLQNGIYRVTVYSHDPFIGIEYFYLNIMDSKKNINNEWYYKYKFTRQVKNKNELTNREWEFLKEITNSEVSTLNCYLRNELMSIEKINIENNSVNL